MLGSQPIIAFIPTRNPERARVFYAETLGLRFLVDDGFALVFDANGVMVRIAKVHEFVPFPFTLLGWEVKGIHDFVFGLRRKGVVFEQFSFMRLEEAVWTAPEAQKSHGSKTRMATCSPSPNT